MNVVLFGPPGSGKGTQASRLKERLNIAHISTGDLLREAVANGTELGKKVESILASGGLVSDEIVLGLIQEAVGDEKSAAAANGWVLDGFPRTLGQAKALAELVEEAGTRIDKVIVLDVDRDSVIERLSARRTCVNCKAVYHLVANPTTKDGICDVCGGEVVQREDDKPETIANRLDVYESETIPILDFYEGKVEIRRIDGSLPVDEVTKAIEGLLR